jgi:hypothetical protein
MQLGFIRSITVNILAFMDDLFNKMNMIPHGPCGGLKGACVICIQVLEAALERMNFLDKLWRIAAWNTLSKGT